MAKTIEHNGKKYLPVKDFADKMEISVQAVYQGLKAGTYQGYKLGNYQLVQVEE